jgi:hypothetical protein
VATSTRAIDDRLRRAALPTFLLELVALAVVVALPL